MIERHTDHSEYLLFEHFAGFPGLAQGVFTRKRGFSQSPFQGLNCSFTTGDAPATVQRNKDAIVAALGLPLVGAKPVHGAEVVVIERDMIPQSEPPVPATWQERLQARVRRIEADAMLTDVPGFAFCWGYGDCAPILLYDPRHRAIGMAHAGWRGTARAVAPKAIQAMTARYGTRPDELLVGIGPAIGACCYEVNDSVRAAFADEPLARESAVFDERPGPNGAGDTHLFLDIAESNARQVIAAGVLPDLLESCGYCTGCHTDLFYSNRREPSPSGRFAVAIGLRDMRQ